ncbi:class II fructose-bisphosphate aldolase [Conexibacter sp. S30A1]|uniref:class II fructose-bisphosphate aldolase n=1 Tax=Conexibacter sp. S30A1 TaxID=2937800 RepID=UPI00200FC819|nr:class II fructose-bisphosphate aldolase [Conexibacter sp. S30A1]
MTIAALSDLLTDAREHRYAVGYFEAWDVYSLEAVVAAAEAEQSPVIIGIGGLTANHAWLREQGIAVYGAVAAMLAERAKTPTAVMYNEADSLDEARSALGCGFNTVMMVGQGMTMERLIETTAALVAEAHAARVAVEGEFDELGEMRDGVLHDEEARLTDVDAAVEFVRRTNVDCLAVSVGSVHFVTGGYTPTLHTSRIRELADALTVPLVLHGGSGVPPEQLQAAVQAGISKVNVGTRLKQVFGEGLALGLQRASADPNLTYGSRLPGDAMTAAALALTQEIRRYMQTLGSSGKAANK